MNRTLKAFSVYWDDRIRQGKSSSFSGLEWHAIELFFDWLAAYDREQRLNQFASQVTTPPTPEQAIAARLTAERDEAEARAVNATFQMKQAEQQRDAAHAALKEIAEEMRQAIAIAKPAGGNVSIIYLANWQARLLDAALEASAPQNGVADGRE